MSARGRTPPRPAAAPPFAAGWIAQSWPVRVLRAFLGATFVYAGMQKFLDPNFLHAGTPDYIGTQLHDFATGSPIAPLLDVAAHVPVLTGVVIALLEIAVGLGTLLGIADAAWAAIGLGISLVLFLSATWHVHPYFLGSDSIYAVAWAALLAGLLERRRRAARGRVGRGAARAGQARVPEDEGRRAFLRGAAVGIGALFLGVVASMFDGPAAPASTLPPPTGAGSGTKAGGGTGGNAGPSSAPALGGTVVATLDSVPVGGAVPFTDPQAGPAVLCRLGTSDVAAFSRVCTHAGCLVEYDEPARLLVCPCHGAEFDPARRGQPVAGPAPTALSAIPVRIDRATGQVVAQA